MSRLFFADAWLAWILAPLIALWTVWLARQLFSAGVTGRAAIRFSSIGQLQRLRPSWSIQARKGIQLLRVFTVVLVALAILRPQTGRKHSQVLTEGIDIILAVDTSGSMQALDLDADRPLQKRRDRLAVVKDVVAEFVKKRPNDQIGVVVFGEEAYTQCPLTLDHGIVSTFLDQLEIGMAGDGTAIGSAIGTTVRRLKDSQAKSKVVILLTDGRNNSGSLKPAKAAEVAKAFDVKIYTIGAGTRGKAPFLVDGLFGKQPVYQDVEIDEPVLRTIAETTGGTYFRAEDMEALAKIYDQIDELEKTEIKSMSYLEYNEEFSAFIVAALLLLLLEVILLSTRFRKVP